MLNQQDPIVSKWLPGLVVVMMVGAVIVFVKTLLSLPTMTLEMGVLYYINHDHLTWQQVLHRYFVGFSDATAYRPTEYYLYYYLIEPLVGWQNVMGWKVVNSLFFSVHTFSAWALFSAYFRRDFHRQMWTVASCLFCLLMISGPLYYTTLYEGVGADFIYSSLLFWMLRAFYRQMPLTKHEPVRPRSRGYAWAMVAVYVFALTAKEQAAFVVGLLLIQLLFEKIQYQLHARCQTSGEALSKRAILVAVLSPSQWRWDYRLWPLMVMMLLCCGYFVGHVWPTFHVDIIYQPRLDDNYLTKVFMTFFGYNNGYDYPDLGGMNRVWIVLRILVFYGGVYIVIARSDRWLQLRVLQCCGMMLMFIAASVLPVHNSPWHDSVPYALNAMLETVFFILILKTLFERYLSTQYSAFVLVLAVMIVIAAGSLLAKGNLLYRMQVYRGGLHYHLISALQHPPVARAEMKKGAHIIVNVAKDPTESAGCVEMCFFHRYSTNKLFAFVYQDLSIHEHYVADDRQIRSGDLVEWLLAPYPYYFSMHHAAVIDRWWEITTPLWQDKTRAFRPRAIDLLIMKIHSGEDLAVLTPSHPSWKRIIEDLSASYPEHRKILTSLKKRSVQFVSTDEKLQKERAMMRYLMFPEWVK